jgi:hypothetical protein
MDLSILNQEKGKLKNAEIKSKKADKEISYHQLYIHQPLRSYAYYF